MIDNYDRFTKANCLDAVHLIGEKVWFYTRLDLLDGFERPKNVMETLSGIDENSDNPFIMGDGTFRDFPYISAIKRAKP